MHADNASSSAGCTTGADNMPTFILTTRSCVAAEWTHLSAASEPGHAAVDEAGRNAVAVVNCDYLTPTHNKGSFLNPDNHYT
jgi:hypothetical protein